jgi:hypothetical protein
MGARFRPSEASGLALLDRLRYTPIPKRRNVPAEPSTSPGAANRAPALAAGGPGCHRRLEQRQWR